MKQQTLTNILELGKVTVPVLALMLGYYVSTVVAPLDTRLGLAEDQVEQYKADRLEWVRERQELRDRIETLEDQLHRKASVDVVNDRHEFILKQFDNIHRDMRELRKR